MIEVLDEIWKWSEVWALFIPIGALFSRKKQPRLLTPVIIYLFIALYLNILADVSWRLKTPLNFPHWFRSNTFVYNAHSIIRFILFGWFFIMLNQPFLTTLKKVTFILFVVFVIVNFSFLQDFFYFNMISSRLHTIETGLLMIYCLIFYFYLLTGEQTSFRNSPAFWVVTGLSIFIITSFPIYLFYEAAIKHYESFIANIWTVQKIAYLIFCIFIAGAFLVKKNDD